MMTHLTWPQRIYLGAVAALGLTVGMWCYFAPGHSNNAIPWNVPPLCAGLLGAMYLSGAFYCASSMLARRWVDARAVMPTIAIWTGGLLLVSLFYLPLFDFSRLQVQVWFVAYIVYPLIALGLVWTHRAQRNVHAAGDPSLPLWARRYLRVQASLMIGLGLALLLAPEPMLRLWPWQTGKLMLQLYSMPMLAYGIGSLDLARQHTWPEVRLGLVAMGLFTGLELASLLRYPAQLDGPVLSVALGMAWLALTTLALAWLAWHAFQPASARQPGSRRAPVASLEQA